MILEKEQQNLFLIYPDIERILIEAPTMSTSIVRCKASILRLKKAVHLNSKWSDEQKAEVLKLYEYFENYFDRYYRSYRDIMSREKIDESEDKEEDISTSVITPFFKELPIGISKQVPHISFTFSGRFKTFDSFSQKAITIIESRSLEELESFYDLHACKFMVSSYACPDNEHDYPTAELECYEMMNILIHYLITEKKCNPMKAKYVGPTSENIREEYRAFVKDYIYNPKKSGYKALHASFSVEFNGHNHFFEVQIVSKHMEAMNNKGDAAHKNHKTNTKIPFKIDYSKVQFPDFEWDSNDPTAIPIDDAGLVIPKELTKRKVFRRIV